MEALEARLRGRATEDEDSIAERLAVAARELEQAGWFEGALRSGAAAAEHVDGLLGEVGGR